MRCFGWLALAAMTAALQACAPAVVVGVGAGTMMGADRRTSGSYLLDARIEATAANQIYSLYKDSVHVNVTSFNGHVLLTGEVPADSGKSAIEKNVLGIPGVKGVSNELAVSAQSSFASRSNDSLITSNVKLRFLNNNIFRSDHIKVVTENGIVYLMGLVYRKEAKAAIDIASRSKGIRQVVTVFEYLD